VRRIVSVALPVAAFAVAFLVGMATRPGDRTQTGLAPATHVSGSTVTLSAVTPVPRPAKLVVKPPPTKTVKPPLTSVPLGAISLGREVPAVPVVRAAAARPAPTSVRTAPAAGTSTPSSSRTTTATTPSGQITGGPTTGGQTIEGTNGGGTPVTGAGSTTSTTSTTSATSTVPAGG
jgi:hypothetical protein